MRRAVIILPTYNESKTVITVIERIFENVKNLDNWDVHITVVDSDSPDGTGDIVDDLKRKYENLHLICSKKEGLGKAYIEGFKMAIQKLNPYVLFEMDADMSHNPDDVPRFLEKIEQGADFVIGSRYIKGGSIPADWGLHRKILSICANIIIRFGFMKLNITDWTSGFRAIKVWVIQKSIDTIQNYTGYVFQVALLDNAIKSGARIEENPINFIDRKEGVSKINSVQYIIQTFFYVFTHSSFIKFCIVGVIGFIVDFGVSHLFIDRFHTAIWLSTIISAECALVSNFLFNNFWAFSHKKVKESILWSFAKFNGISIGSIGIQTIGMQICSIIFGRDHWTIYKFFIILFVIIPYSYFFYNKFVWKDK